MLTKESSYLAFWAPRIGDEAARLQWSNVVYAFWGWMAAVASMAFFIFGVRLHAQALLWLAGVMVAAFVVCVWMSFRRIRQTNLAASNCLGIMIGFRQVPNPPKLPERYEAWCRNYSLVPYSANEAAPTAAGGSAVGDVTPS